MGEISSPLKLVRRWKADVDLRELVALAHRLAQDRPLIGFAYGPERAVWVAVNAAGALSAGPGESLPKGIFELRLFDAVCEWRWLHTEIGAKASVVTEDPSAAPVGWTNADTEAEIEVEAVDRSWLLWGSAVSGAPAGWTRLASPRTGPFLVPELGLMAEQGAALQARVYLGRCDEEDGNVGVVDERIVGLTRAKNATTGGAT